jgi:hypothetical protein
MVVHLFYDLKFFSQNFSTKLKQVLILVFFNGGFVYFYSLSIMRGSQLPLSAAWWQHGSQICFANFYLVKNHKFAKKNSTNTKSRVELDTDSFKFEIFFDVCLT